MYHSSWFSAVGQRTPVNPITSKALSVAGSEKEDTKHQQVSTPHGNVLLFSESLEKLGHMSVPSVERCLEWL